MTPLALSSLSRDELRRWLVARGHPAYRADQIRRHLLRAGEGGFSSMADLPLQLRTELERSTACSSLEVLASTAADRGLTKKLLLRTAAGHEVEAVMITHPPRSGSRGRRTVCVSSQAGCAIGCVFCATGRLGLRANLAAAEIVDQVLEAARRWDAERLGRPTNVVLMGMGEPLQNYSEVVSAIRLLHEWGIPPRQVVLSTSGLVPEIMRLAQEGLGVRLAISLHATHDQLRDRLVPINRRFPIASLLDAARSYAAASGRRVTLEYVLIRGVNDDSGAARTLGQMAAAIHGHVNLIPMNPIPGSDLRAPSPPACREFAALVGPRATIRHSRGDRATAACGQLRASLAAEPRRERRILAQELALVESPSGQPA
jgi:23S rRNA (adenine2503-C2)-methyltransferase